MSDAPTLSGLSVLVLEDDFYLAEDTREALEAAGAAVVGPIGQLGGIGAALEDGTPDCALVDVNLGAGPDFAPVRMLVERGIPVAFLTGYDAGVIPPDLADVPCLQKPTSSRRIVSTVSALCGR